MQQQKSVLNYAKTKMQLQQNVQQTWLNDTDDDVILISRLECYYPPLLLMSVRKS